MPAGDRLGEVLDATGAGLWEWEIATDGATYSPQFKALLGYPEAAFPPDFSFFAAVHPEERDAVFDAVAAAIQERCPFDEEFRVAGDGGAYRWLRGTGRAVCDENGTVLRFIGMARDISARKWAEHALAKELEERRKVDRMRRDLFTAANHELRTPLAGIVAALELLREPEMPLGQSREACLEVALQSTEQLARVVEQWLDLDRMDLGIAGMQRVPVGLAGLVAAQLAAAAAAAAARGVQLETLEAGDVQVNVDPERLGQAVAHVLANAILRSARGAAVRVRVGRRGNKAVVLVEDVGGDVQSDTNLGLSACKAIVARQGGFLEVANRAARGATFYMELPCAQADSAVP
jgi:PAS domain S-box-containing protein